MSSTPCLPSSPAVCTSFLLGMATATMIIMMFGLNDSVLTGFPRHTPNLSQAGPAHDHLVPAREHLVAKKTRGDPYVGTPQSEFPKCDVDGQSGFCKPGFMLIGVQKSGSSTLYKLLASNPQILPAKQKELVWWADNHRLWLDQRPPNFRCEPDPATSPTSSVFSSKYLSLFPKISPNGRKEVTAEFSVTYLHCWCCPQSFQRLLPSVRLATILRHPVNRAYSRWKEQAQMASSKNWKANTLHRVLKSNFSAYASIKLPELQKCLAKNHNESLDGLKSQVFCIKSSSIFGLSLYSAPLKFWRLWNFSVLVLYNYDLETQPMTVMRAIERHVGLTPHDYPDTLLHQHFNTAKHLGWDNKAGKTESPSTADDLDASTRTVLVDFYREDVKELKVMADEGSIAALPQPWVETWAL